MIQPTQQHLLDVLAQLCDRSPGVRFGQLVAHLGFLAEDQGNPGLWDIEDLELLTAMKQHLDELSRRQDPIAEPQSHLTDPATGPISSGQSVPPTR